MTSKRERRDQVFARAEVREVATQGESMMSEPTNQWTERDSATFLDLGELLVPGRAEQIGILLQLLPANIDEVFTVAELGAGGGVLAQAVLERFPGCRYLAFDGSETMREHMREKLATFSDRLEIRAFDLASQGWRVSLPSPLRCVLSSLCVHHLPDEGKRELFGDMAARLEHGGALLLADIIEPANSRVAGLYAQQYDDVVRRQSLQTMGDLRGYERFSMLKWNYFAYDYASPEPDPYDQPSLLSEQLRWLSEAGFTQVDCFWMQAGHAIYGGYKA
jgi:phospholipid N-methyltransferase